MKASVRAILDGLIDYAGLFPPAGLSMADAVANYATYRRGPYAWMLGRFIVPVRRLDEFESAAASRLPAGPGAIPWRLSVLAADLPSDRAAIDAFNARHAASDSGAARIDTIEIKLDPGADVAAIAAHAPVDAALWFEVTPGPSLGADLARLAETGHGAKLRTGGISSELIPSAATVAQVLLGCARAGVRMKATAGLHHPVRAPHRLTYADDSPTAVMHGFLNVFVGAALARQLVLHRYPEPEAQVALVALLDDTDPHAFSWHDDAVIWRRHRMDVSTLTAVRADAARSFGSCSFEEPIEDLQRLGLLEAWSTARRHHHGEP